MKEKDNTEYYSKAESSWPFESEDETSGEERWDPPGLFSVSPIKNLLHGPVQLFLLMLVVSLYYWTAPGGRFLVASGEKVFQEGEIWRLFTSLLVHGDFSHLLANGWIFILFGWMLRSYFGLLAFPLLSFLAGIITSAVTVYLYPPQTGLIGASGMVHSMVALWICWYIFFEKSKSLGQRILRASGFALAMLVPAVVKPGVSYLAHGAGFLTGILLAILFLPFIQSRVNKIENELLKEWSKSEEKYH